MLRRSCSPLTGSTLCMRGTRKKTALRGGQGAMVLITDGGPDGSLTP